MNEVPVNVHIPEIEAFVPGNLCGGVASEVAALGEAGARALARRVKQAPRPCAQGDAVVYPDEINIAAARK